VHLSDRDQVELQYAARGICPALAISEHERNLRAAPIYRFLPKMPSPHLVLEWHDGRGVST
jgi:hypothetical protein